jgi:hypothetical protein
MTKSSFRKNRITTKGIHYCKVYDIFAIISMQKEINAKGLKILRKIVYKARYIKKGTIIMYS